MRNLILAGLIVLLAACSSKPEFHIKGTIQSDFQGKVFLKKQNGYAYEIIDSTIVENNAFEFIGEVEFPDLYSISFSSEKKNHRICLENTKYQIVFTDIESIEEVVGGKYQPIMTDFVSKMTVIEKEESELIDLIWRDPNVTQEQKDTLYIDLASLRENKVAFANNYIQNNSGSPHTPMVLDIYIRNFLSIDQLDSVYQTLTEDARNSNVGSRIGKSIVGTRQSTVGKPMIDFSMPGLDGDNITLSEVVRNNKLVFIDFWASWCGPCRASIPELKEIYKNYHSKGLEILAVSYDDNSEDWIKAIEEEELNWPNASNLAGWNCPTASEYAIRGIPANVLITQDGIIAARTLYGQNLRDKIEELLKSE